MARLLPPESAAIDTVAHELSISVATLERWRAQALSRPARERAWTAAARFEAVLATAAMDETRKGAWCREQGLYPQELERWRIAATQALAEAEEVRASPGEEAEGRGGRPRPDRAAIARKGVVARSEERRQEPLAPAHRRHSP